MQAAPHVNFIALTGRAWQLLTVVSCNAGNGNRQTAVIIASAVGAILGAALIAGVIGLVFWVRRRRRQDSVCNLSNLGALPHVSADRHVKHPKAASPAHAPAREERHQGVCRWSNAETPFGWGPTFGGPCCGSPLSVLACLLLPNLACADSAMRSLVPLVRLCRVRRLALRAVGAQADLGSVQLDRHRLQHAGPGTKLCDMPK